MSDRLRSPATSHLSSCVPYVEQFLSERRRGYKENLVTELTSCKPKSGYGSSPP
ncbi:hypothetical protein EGR_06831 [Echinococcus granulosus]|uniref:Uncharacterized protein n=1 Tax=Echinococcus granulosus TaxID=6210 RepID=W6UXL6_ECHGR|nr:hypothetical protein EGR_06831 [Echinococcus granulosus]EUB58304.1 hypothetical protein EGR_06831 [Echinococcus granulosus]